MEYLAFVALLVFCILMFVAFIIVDTRVGKQNREIGENKARDEGALKAMATQWHEHEHRIDSLVKRANDHYSLITSLKSQGSRIQVAIDSDLRDRFEMNKKLSFIYDKLIQNGTFVQASRSQEKRIKAQRGEKLATGTKSAVAAARSR